MSLLHAQAATNTIYSGIWRRIGAYFIDYLAIVFVSIAVMFVIYDFELGGDEEGEPFLSLTWMALYFLYCTIMESSRVQATLGKLAVGIKVTDRSGRRIGFGRATGRFFAKFVSSLTLCIGYLMAAFTQRRQALHDMIAGTLVVLKTTDESVIATNTGAARPASAWVVAAIIAGCLVPLTGILAAIAIPAYQDYTIRAQVTEGLMLATPHKAAVAETYERGGLEFGDIDLEAADMEVATGKYVQSVEIVSGAVVITYGEAANPHLKGRVLVLVPALNEHKKISWACGYGQAEPGFEPILEDHGQYSDVESKYLPSACRVNGQLPRTAEAI